MAVKEMKNVAIVEGILSEIKLEKLSVERNGKTQDLLRGDIVIRVEQSLNKGEDAIPLDVSVRCYAHSLTNSNNENPSFATIDNILSNGKSIAVVGIDNADCVRVTGTTLSMQEYYTPDGRFVNFPSVSGSFFNVIKRSDMVPKANFTCECVIAKMEYLTDKEGVELDPKTLQISGVNVGYNDYTNVIPFVTRRPDIIGGIEASYGVGDTITLSGLLNFDSKIETYLEPVEIGDPIERQKTVFISEAIITGVAPRELGSYDYTKEEINGCLAKRTARLEEKKEKAASKTAGTETRSKNAHQQKVDLGF